MKLISSLLIVALALSWAFQVGPLLGLAVVAWLGWLFWLARDLDPPPLSVWEGEGGYISLLDDTKVHRCWNCDKPIPISAMRCRHCGVEQRR